MTHMDTLEILDQINKRANGTVSIEFAPHRRDYQSVEEYLRNQGGTSDEYEWHAIPESVRAVMVEKDMLVEVRVYPDSRTSFLLAFHYELRAALEQIMKELWPQEPQQREGTKHQEQQEAAAALAVIHKRLGLTGN